MRAKCIKCEGFFDTSVPSICSECENARPKYDAEKHMKEAILKVAHELGHSPELQGQLDRAIGYDRKAGNFR